MSQIEEIKVSTSSSGMPVTALRIEPQNLSTPKEEAKRSDNDIRIVIPRSDNEASSSMDYSHIDTKGINSREFRNSSSILTTAKKDSLSMVQNPLIRNNTSVQARPDPGLHVSSSDAIDHVTEPKEFFTQREIE
jgi:hypothetical protein